MSVLPSGDMNKLFPNNAEKHFFKLESEKAQNPQSENLLETKKTFTIPMTRKG